MADSESIYEVKRRETKKYFESAERDEMLELDHKRNMILVVMALTLADKGKKPLSYEKLKEKIIIADSIVESVRRYLSEQALERIKHGIDKFGFNQTLV